MFLVKECLQQYLFGDFKDFIYGSRIIEGGAVLHCVIVEYSPWKVTKQPPINEPHIISKQRDKDPGITLWIFQKDVTNCTFNLQTDFQKLKTTSVHTQP